MLDEALAAVEAAGGSITNAALALGIPRPTFQHRVTAARRASSAPGAQPRKPTVRRFLLTAAQDDTAIHEGFWTNLLAYAAHLGAEILVGGFTYQKGLFEDHASRSAVFAEAVRPYLRHENVQCGPLLFAAKMNILPTAVRPLSGLETYSRGAWAVFPHAKTQMLSVPAMAGQHPAHVFTTGACTQPNYIEKKAGLKAEFHHTIGAVIVEVCEDDVVFARHIGATSDGDFQDLDALVRRGEVTQGNRIEHLTAGDLHIEKGDPAVFLAAFGYDLSRREITSDDSMLHTLRPRHVTWHDIVDFMARNHHRRQDPHFAARMLTNGTDGVENEIRAAAAFLRATAYDWTTSVVAASNHHDALTRWLREADPRADPRNMGYWCRLNAEVCRRIDIGDRGFDIFRWALAQHDARGLDDIVFVPRNGSYRVCQTHGGIEVGAHGDEGPNGARGPVSLVRVAEKMNVGHAHTPQVLDGLWIAGLCGMLDQGYNSGPSGWSHTQIVTTPNGKRQLVTIRDGRWRA